MSAPHCSLLVTDFSLGLANNEHFRVASACDNKLVTRSRASLPPVCTSELASCVGPYLQLEEGREIAQMPTLTPNSILFTISFYRIPLGQDQDDNIHREKWMAQW